MTSSASGVTTSPLSNTRLERATVFPDQLRQAGVIAHGSDDQPGLFEGPAYVGPDLGLVHEVNDPDQQLPVPEPTAASASARVSGARRPP